MSLHARPAGLAAAIPLILLLALLPSCSENPADTGNSTPMEGQGEIDPGSGKDFLLATVDMGPGFQGLVEVWAYNLAAESDSIVAFDLVMVNGTDGDIPPPLLFVITKIFPNTVTCFNPDGYLRERMPFYDFSDDLGDDDLLTPGERTAPVHVQFRWSEPTAFGIGFRLSIGDVIRRGMIAGVVFRDLNQNGIRERNEPGIPDVAIRLRGSPEDSVTDAASSLVRTDEHGYYEFTGLSAAVYEVEAVLLPGVGPTTSNPLLVALVELPDGKVSSYYDAHFGVAVVVPPPNWVFGPVSVGPGFETRVDSTFVIPTPMPPVPPFADLYFVRVDPPPIMGPYPTFIERVTVAIDNHIVYKFECPPDALCPPRPERVPIEPILVEEGEHTISIEVLGSERAFLLVGIEHDTEGNM